MALFKLRLVKAFGPLTPLKYDSVQWIVVPLNDCKQTERNSLQLSSSFVNTATDIDAGSVQSCLLSDQGMSFWDRWSRRFNKSSQ